MLAARHDDDDDNLTNDISLKMNVKVQLEFEEAYYHVTVHYVSDYTSGTLLLLSSDIIYFTVIQLQYYSYLIKSN